MERSESIDQLAGALAVAQGLIENAAKDSANPYFRSKYADLASIWDVIRAPLSANGLSIVQPVRVEGSTVTVTTLLAHSSGQWISSDLSMAAQKQLKDGGGWEKLDSPQAIGSCITYARRYALAAMTGVAPEDDDAEVSEGRQGPTQAQSRDSNGDGTRTLFEPDFALNKMEISGKYGKPQEYWNMYRDAVESAVAVRGKKMMGTKEFAGWFLTVDEKTGKPPVAERKPAAAPLAAQPVPATLEQVLATFGTKEGRTAAYARLKEHFLKVLDANIWDQILAENNYSASIGTAKKAFTAAWNTLQREMEANSGAEPPEMPEGA